MQCISELAVTNSTKTQGLYETTKSNGPFFCLIQAGPFQSPDLHQKFQAACM